MRQTKKPANSNGNYRRAAGSKFTIFPPLKNVSVPLFGLTSLGSLINDGGGCYDGSNITGKGVVKEALFRPKMQLNDAFIASCAQTLQSLTTNYVKDGLGPYS